MKLRGMVSLPLICLLSADPLNAADAKVYAAAGCVADSDQPVQVLRGTARVSLVYSGSARRGAVCGLTRDNTLNTTGLDRIEVLLDRSGQPITLDCWADIGTPDGDIRQSIRKVAPVPPAGNSKQLLVWTNSDLSISAAKDVYSVTCYLPSVTSPQDEESVLGIYYSEP